MSELRVCVKCGESKLLTPEFFRWHNLGHGGPRRDCRECERKARKEHYAANPEAFAAATRKWSKDHPEQRNATKRAWYAKNKEKHKDAVLRRTYGISLEEYTSRLNVQGGGCAICGAKQADLRGRKLHVDHCHETKIVRGLLCKDCNTMLGYARDRIDILQAAVEYLRK